MFRLPKRFQVNHGGFKYEDLDRDRLAQWALLYAAKRVKNLAFVIGAFSGTKADLPRAELRVPAVAMGTSIVYSHRSLHLWLRRTSDPDHSHIYPLNKTLAFHYTLWCNICYGSTELRPGSWTGHASGFCRG